MMATHLSTRTSSQDLAGPWPSASPIDHALTLFLADETEAALRWGAAALERDPLLPTALIVTSRLLDQMGRTRAAVDGLRLAANRAIETGDLPVAIAAIDDLRILGADAGEHLDRAAMAFGRGSPRLQATQSFLPAARPGGFIEPLSPFLGGPALASKATQILQAAKQAYELAMGAELPPFAPLPLFSAISVEPLRELLSAFQMITVPAGHPIIQEGEEGTAAYIVAQGEVELSRRAAHGDNKPRLAIARLGSGAFFGEMALLSQLPSATSVTATRPSILLVGRRDTLVSIATRYPEVAVQLAAHCRRNSLANLGWTSPVVASIPVEERATLVERLQMRLFQRGEKLVRDREEAKGLHLIMSGEVAIVAREWSERVLLATLGAGETVGEVELVLCRQAFADAIAVRPTAALFLSRDEYSALVQERPAILHGLYATAVRRHAETRLALESGSATIDDDWLLDEEATVTRAVPERAPMPRILAPPPTPPPVAPHASTRPPPPPPQSVFVPPPQSVYVENETPPTPSVAPAPSIAPSASSIWPQRAVSSGGRSTARLTMAAGAALVASAAGVLFVLALRYGHPAGPPSTAPAAANPPPVVAPTTTWTVSPPDNGPVAATPARSPANNKSKLPKPPTRPRIVASQPTNEVTAAVQAAAAGSSSSAGFNAPATTGPKLSTRASSEVDDFGGRE